ncbi:MAG: restriction endonuclease subunit S [Candidatus Omnitrophica bacterium]|nr:restriction endonuclease subunit S [Candidatus Omnitrophota bacterium]
MDKAAKFMYKKMNKIKKLIAELCPNGVEFKTLKNVANSITTGKLNANAQVENGAYPFFTCDANPFKINTYAFDVEAIIVSGNGSQVGHINYYHGKFNAYQRTYVISGFNDSNVKYLLHYLRGSLREYIFANSRKGSVPYITMPMLDNFIIPIPSLKVQKEIVKILDNFTKLEAELEAELEARKKQYEYYRDELLTFGEGQDEVDRKTIKDLFDFKNGLNKGKEFFGKGTPIVNFTDVFKNRSLVSSDLKGKVEVTSKEKLLYSAQKNDIFFTRTSETQEDIGMAAALLDDVEDCVFSGFVLRARPKTDLLNPKFCSYFLTSNSARKEIIRNSTFTTRALTSGGRLSKIQIPIPPLAEQERIVSILDKFDALVNDISIGLPAELNARRKQYEYYRNQLLTFKPLEKQNVKEL